MDINALRVFDSIYKLKLEDKDYEQIEEELKREDVRGLFIQTIKKDYLIGVDHDDKHKIVIKKIDSDVDIVPGRVLFKTLCPIMELPKEIYTLHEIGSYRAQDKRVIYSVKTIEQLKDRICDRFADGYPKELGDMYEEAYGDSDLREKNAKRRPVRVEKELKALYWLFNEDYEKEIIKPARPNIPRIVKVFSRNNRRLAIIQVNEDYNKKRGGCCGNSWTEEIKRTVFKIKSYSPKDQEYNYVSPNREMYLPGEYDERGEIWLDEDLFEKVSISELKLLSKIMPHDDWIYMNADRYSKQQSAIKLELIAAKRKDQQEKAQQVMKKNVKKQYLKGKVVRHGIEFSKDKISYEGYIFKNNLIGKFIEQESMLEVEQPDFSKIYSSFIDYILAPEVTYGNDYNGYDEQNRTVKYKFEGEDTIQVNKINVIITKRGNVFYINGCRIKQSDVPIVVKDAIKYDSQEEYNKFVEHTSRVNLDIQTALVIGSMEFVLKIDNTNDCDIKVAQNYFDFDKSKLSLPISRKDKKLYTNINKKEYRIKDINSLFDLGKEVERTREGHMQRTIKLLYRAIEGITHKQIGEMILNGHKEYLKMIRKKKALNDKKLKRSKEFVAHAIKITKAVLTKNKEGWIVKGTSGTNYYVGKDCSVYTVDEEGKTDKYLCIVDDDYDYEDSQWKENDRIAKRLLALNKDKKVAKEIWDRGDKVDSHWEEIMEV